MKITVLGIDLAKHVFQLHGVDEHGWVQLRKRLSRHKLLEFLAQLPACLLGMEACGGAHYWGREIRRLGHEVRLIPPQYVKPKFWHRCFWARGYLAVSSGTITDEMVKEYIDEQEGEQITNDSRFQIDSHKPLDY